MMRSISYSRYFRMPTLIHTGSATSRPNKTWATVTTTRGASGSMADAAGGRLTAIMHTTAR
jgi:hypothetical protein